MKAKTYINREGYRAFSDSGKLVHRWVATKKYGHKEVEGKEVHHIDGNKLNNEKSNLIILNKEDHYNLSQYENRNKFITTIIIYLAIFYLIIIWILMFSNFLNRDISLALARMSVYAILIVALELKYGFIKKWIRSTKGK